MKILVTGATGFLGKALVARLIADGRIGDAAPFTSLTLMGRTFTDPPTDPRVRLVRGDICDSKARAESLADSPDVVFHLAGALIAQTEPNFDLGRAVNLVASLDLCEDLRAAGLKPRFVFASTIGVYGPALPDPVTDDTLPRPNLTYGAHKLMVEYYLADLTRKGFLDARSVRIPGTLPRPRLPDRAFSPAFGSNLIHAMAAGEAFHSPVSQKATLWAVSRRWTIDNMLRSAALAPDLLPAHRVWQLPALQVSMEELATVLGQRFGADRLARITWDPVPELESALGTLPRLVTATADRLGLRHDGDVPTLVSNVLDDLAHNPL